MESISLEVFLEMRNSSIPVLDSRPTYQFSAQHIPDSIGISINGSFEYMLNCIFPSTRKLILVSEKERLSESLLRLEGEGFSEIHYFDFKLWFDAGMESSQISRVKASEASKHLERIIDVSNSEDWEVLHVKGISNIPLIELVKSPDKIKSGSVLYCGNGHKSVAAASFLLTKNIVTSDITGGLSAMLVDSPDLEI
jgi:rhodanese-related sulfurtransferase